MRKADNIRTQIGVHLSYISDIKDDKLGYNPKHDQYTSDVLGERKHEKLTEAIWKYPVDNLNGFSGATEAYSYYLTDVKDNDYFLGHISNRGKYWTIHLSKSGTLPFSPHPSWKRDLMKPHRSLEKAEIVLSRAFEDDLPVLTA